MKHQLFLTIILIFLGLFFFQSIGFSQDNPDPTIYPVTDITPPDPTNAAFDKFLNIPVSLFTGTPEISIPLWKVSQGILNIPITLSYHASGVKIDEISGWVGQGWLLNAGGIINRTIMGLPDESQNSGYFYNKNIVPESPTELYIFDNYRDLSTLYNLSKGTIDAQPDIFSYNIPSHNGNFVMHCTPKSGNPPFSLSPVIYPYENLKIIYYSSYSTSVDFNKWEIIDEKGIKYIFDVSLKSQSEATDCSPRHFNVNTSWYLSKIISPNGKDSITFYYTDYFSNNYSLPAEIKKHKYSTEEEFHCFEDYYYEYCSNETTSIQKRLSKIQYNNCILEFIQSNPFDNQDLCVLNKINIKQLNPDKLLKSFSFSYHLNSDRIILDSLKEICQSDSLPPYKFSYYCLDHLPGTFSSSRDHWGFFNGKNNPGLIPSVYFLNQELPGADRSPDTSKMIYGVLNKIQYPTGGSICFDFEAGDYSHYANGYKVTHYYTQNKEIGLSRPCDNVPYCFQYCPIEIKTDSFYLDHDQQINMYLYATNVRIPNERESSLIILDSTGVNQVAYLNSSSSSLTQYGTFNLITGKYYAKLFANQCDDTHGTVSYSSLNFQNDTLNYNHIEYGGGIRIKRINFSDGQKSFIKRYLYRNADGTSTGYLFGQNPVYEYFSSQSTFCSNIPNPSSANIEKARFFIRTSKNLRSLASANGCHVGYLHVTELFGENGENGKINYHYSFAQDITSDFFPFAPAISRSWKRGLLLDKVESDVNGNILNEEYNKYKFYCDTAQTKFKSVNGIKVGFTFYNLPNPFYGSNYGIAPYQVLTEFPMLYSKTIIKHNQNNNSLKVIDSTHYYYSDSCLLSKIESWNSLGEKNITVIKYPYDYSTSITNEPISQAINMFKENHIILPIEKMIFIKHSSEDSLLLSSSIMTYTIQSINNKNFIFPKDLYDTKLVTPKQNYIPSTILNGVFSFDQSIFKRESSIDSYNEFDRMTQMHKENNVNNSYIWGYNNQYMVIKAVNIDAVSLSTIVNNIQPDFQSFLTGLDDLTDPAKRSQWKLFNNTLRSGLPPNSRAETFTYLPFIGITSKTDEAGITTYYYYDDFGRLLNVKDEEGNIVKKYDYHYQGQ